MSANEAEKKFWKSPELLEGLLPFLDPPSILELAKVHPLTTGVIQSTYNWSRLIRRSCPHPTEIIGLEQKLAKMGPIIGILKMMGSPQFHLLALLDIICKRFTPCDDPSGDPYSPKYDCFKVTCPNHEVHHVSTLGFMLLELVEGAVGSSDQKVEWINIMSIKGPFIPALKSRAMRQEREIRWIDTFAYHCQTQNDAEAFLTLAQCTKEFGFRTLVISGEIREQGWAALAEALKLLSPLVLDTYNPDDFDGDDYDGDGGLPPLRGVQSLIVGDRNFLLDGRREDWRAVWDALPEGSYLLLNKVKTTAEGPLDQKFFSKGSQEASRMLELYLDNADVFVAQNENSGN